MTTKSTTTPALTLILNREEALTEKLNEFSDPAFYARREAAFEKARKGDATDKDRDDAAAAVDGRLSAEFAGQREAISLTLEAHRKESFATFVAEFVKPTLEARKARRDRLHQTINDLNREYPGAHIAFDQGFDLGPLDQLQQLAWADQAPPHFDMTGFVANYSA